MLPRAIHADMSTCPRCKGYLTDSHRCPNRPTSAATEVTLAAVAGGVGGLVLVTAIDPVSHVTALDLVAVACGACLGVAIDRFLRS